MVSVFATVNIKCVLDGAGIVFMIASMFYRNGTLSSVEPCVRLSYATTVERHSDSTCMFMMVMTTGHKLDIKIIFERWLH